jgi:WD40 repeat protein
MKKVILILLVFLTVKIQIVSGQNIISKAEWINWGWTEGNDINSLDYSVNGKYFASGGDHQIILYNAESYEMIKIFRTSLSKTSSVCFSQNDKFLVSGGNDSLIYIWKSENFSLMTTISVEDKIKELKFSKDGKYLLACIGSNDNLCTVKIFNADTFRLYRDFSTNHYNIISALITEDNTELIALKGWSVNENVQNNPCVMVINIATNKIERVLKEFTDIPNTLLQSNDGQYLACCVEISSTYPEYESGIWVYNTNMGQEIFVESELVNYNNISAFSFSPDNSFLVTVSNSEISTINLQNGETIQTFNSALKHINSIKYSNDGKQLLVGGYNNVIEVWDLNDYEIVKLISGSYGINDQGSVRTIAFSPNGNSIASGSGSSRIKIWNAHNGSEIKTIESRSANQVLTFSPNSEFIAAAYDSLIDIYNANTGKLVKTLAGHRREINGFTKLVRQMNFIDENHLISASDDKTVKLWEIETGNCLKTFYDTTGQRYENPSGCYSFVLLNEDSLLLTGHFFYIKVWNYHSGEELYAVHKRELGFIYKLFYDNLNQTINSYNNSHVWQIDLKNKAVGQSFDLGNFRDIAHSNNKKYAATCHDNGDIKIWDVSSYENIYTYRTGIHHIYSLVWSPDDKSIVFGANDGTIIKIGNVNDDFKVN